MTSLAFASAIPSMRRAVLKMFRAHRLAGLLGVAMLGIALGGCSVVRSPTQARGHKVEEDLLKELVPGTSTRADVTALLGSPTARATFDDSTWIYMASVTRTRVGRMPGVDSQDVTVMTFTPAGVLQNIRRLNQEDAVSVDVVARTTPTPGNEVTFLQEFLGNVGRLNPGGLGRAGGGAGTGTAR